MFSVILVLGVPIVIHCFQTTPGAHRSKCTPELPLPPSHIPHPPLFW